MGARPLTDLGLTMLGSLPPRVRGSIDYQAVMHAAAREVALLEAAIETVRAQFNPATADVLLDAWEAMFKLPVGGPAGADTAARRSLVLARLQKLVTSGEGQEWEAAITGIVGAGWSYLEHDPANPSSPPDGEVTITLPFPLGSADYLNAQNQIRDITDAHLVINFASSALFRLDVSQWDVDQFDA